MIESTVMKRGQITLPKPVRDALGVQAGDRVRYVVLDGEVRILPVRPIRRLFGALKHDGPPVTTEEMEQAAADGAAAPHFRRQGGANGGCRTPRMTTNSVQEKQPQASTSLAPMAAVGPWYDQAGAEGMRAPVERMKRLARQLEPEAQFSDPEVVSAGDEDGVALTFVVVDICLPRGSDGMAFRDSFFEALVDTLHPHDLGRLAVGVWSGRRAT